MFEVKGFRGLRPKVDPLYLGPGEAAESVDAEFHTGLLAPLRQPTVVMSGAAGKEGLAVVDTDRLLLFDAPVRQALAGERTIVVAEDGSTPPRYADASESGTTLYRLGMPKPASAPVVTLNTAGEGGTEDSISFAYAYVNKFGDVGPLSDIATFPTTVNARVNVTVANLADSAYQLADAKIVIYRTTHSSGLLFPVGPLEDNASGNSVHIIDLDSSADDSYLGFPRNIYSGEAGVPEAVDTLLAHPNGFWVAKVGDTVRMSVIGELHTWPPEYTFQVPGRKIIGIGLNVDQVYVFPEDAPPVVLSMTTPANAQRTQTAVPWPCVSAASIVNTGAGVFYAAQAGVVALSGAQGRLITEAHLDRASFAQYSPRDIRAFHRDGVYHAYGNGRPFRLDIQSVEGPFQMLESSEALTDAKVFEGDIYGVNNGTVLTLETSSRRHQFRWKGGHMRFPHAVTLAGMQVRADYRSRMETLVVGGIGLGAVGDFAVGDDPTILVDETITPRVRFSLYDRDGNRLALRLIDEQKSQPLRLNRKVDTVQVGLVADIPVESASIAFRQKDQS